MTIPTIYLVAPFLVLATAAWLYLSWKAFEWWSEHVAGPLAAKFALWRVSDEVLAVVAEHSKDKDLRCEALRRLTK